MTATEQNGGGKTDGEKAPVPPRRRTVVLLPLLAFLALSALFMYRLGAGDPSRIPSALIGQPAPLTNLPPIAGLERDGKPVAGLDSAAFKGDVTVLNVWASWCVPCRKEMPALDRLQQQLGGPDFQVVALSIDTGGAAAVRRFYDEIGIHTLAIYVDPTTAATGKLRTLGIPTTLLLDREGRERWRKTGPAEWDSPEIVESLRAKLHTGAS